MKSSKTKVVGLGAGARVIAKIHGCEIEVIKPLHGELRFVGREQVETNLLNNSTIQNKLSLQHCLGNWIIKSSNNNIKVISESAEHGIQLFTISDRFLGLISHPDYNQALMLELVLPSYFKF